MLLKHSLLYLPAQVIGPLVQLVAMVVWTHVIDERSLGIVTLVTAMHEFLQVVLLAWWSQYALRFFGRFQTNGDPTRFYRTENLVLLLSIIAQSAISVVLLLVLIAPDAGAPLIAATVSYVVTRALSMYVAERARVAQQIGIYSVQQIVGPVIGFAIGWAAIKQIAPAPEYPLFGYAIAQLIAVIAVLPGLDRGRGFLPVDREIVRQALRYGAPLVIGGALGWVSLNAPRFVINDFLGVASAGIFAVGYGLGQRAAGMAAMLVTVATYPIAVKTMERDGSGAAMRQLADNGALLMAVLAPATVGVFILRHEIVSTLIAAPFQSGTIAILPLSILAGCIRSVRAHFGDQAFLLHNRTGLSIVVSGIDAMTAVGVGIVAVLAWGLVGAAIASVVAACAAAIVSFALGMTLFKLQLPLLHLLKIAAACLLMGLCLRSLPLANHTFALVMHVVAGAACYLGAISLLYSPWIVRRLRKQSRVAPAE